MPYGLSDQPVVVVQGVGDNAPVTYSNLGVPAIIANFSVAAHFVTPSGDLALEAVIADPNNGVVTITWSDEIAAQLPLGQLCQLNVTLTDTSARRFISVWPVNCVDDA